MNNSTSFGKTQRLGLYSYSRLHDTFEPGCGPSELDWVPCLVYSANSFLISSCVNRDVVNSQFGISNDNVLIV